MSFYKESLVRWLKEKDFKSNRVLSVGCQEDDRRYFKSFECKEYLTLDKDKKFKPDIICDIEYEMPTKNIKNPKNNMYLDYFDDIFTLELWEYISDPRFVLRMIYRLLKKGGCLWISAPFIYPVHEIMEDDMLRYTESFWRKVLPEIGFKIIEYKPRNWFNQTGYWQSISADRMRPSKRFRHHNATGHLIICEKI